MTDFMMALAPDLAASAEAERAREHERGRWRRELKALSRRERAAPARRTVLVRKPEHLAGPQTLGWSKGHD